MARLVGDESFIQKIVEKLHVEQAELAHAQQSEPSLIILQAIVGEVLGDAYETWSGKSIRLSALRDAIFKESGCPLQTRQIGATVRRMEITVKISHGQSVVCPDPIELLKACEEYGYEGEDVEELRKIIPSGRQGGQKQPNTLSRVGEVAPSSTSSTPHPVSEPERVSS